MMRKGILRALSSGAARFLAASFGCVMCLLPLMAAEASIVLGQDAAPAPPSAPAAPAPAADVAAAPATPASPDAADAAPAVGADAAPADEKKQPPKPDEEYVAKPVKPEPERDPRDPSELDPGPIVDLAGRVGIGFMRGGQGGLMTGQMTPITIDVEAMRLKDTQWMYGAVLRMELEQAMAVAGIARVAFRHWLGSLEIRPGAGIPIYVAPRTMLGVEASFGVRKVLSDDGLGLTGSLSAAAFFFGGDIPHGSTVLMFHLFIGIDLLL